MDAKHTPGPWTAMEMPPKSWSDHGWRAMAVCGQTWMVGAPVSVARKVESGIVVSGWDNETNCRLMAAAPDLLAALVALCDDVESCEKARDVYLPQARAAIAKATRAAT